MLQKEKDEIYLIKLWQKVWSWKWILIISAVSTGILSLIVSLILPKVYTAKVIILAPEALHGGFFGGLIGQQLGGFGSKVEITSQTILSLLSSGREKKAVIKKFNVTKTFRLKKGEESEFLDKITNFALNEIEGKITVEVETHSPELSAAMANFYVKNLKTINENIQLTPEKSFLKVVDWATPPTRASKPKIKWNTLIGGFLGFFISLIVLYVRDTIEEIRTL